MSLKRTSWTDSDGRKKIVLLPEEAGDEQAEAGVPVGPPSFADLNLPLDIEVRLNNELVNRGIITPPDALKNRAEIVSAIQAVLKLDAERIVQMYLGPGYKNARQERSIPVQQSEAPRANPRRRR